ncbi:MAG: DUF3800 domain-containing protein [Dehalococcoidia bacterium]
MFIIYLDESGHPDARHFVLAGVALFETDTHPVAQSLDALQAKYLRGPEPVALHASILRGGAGQRNDPYPSLTVEARRNLCTEVYQAISQSPARIMAVALERATVEDAYERAFEEIVNRFDLMLRRLVRQTGRAERGLIIAAESSYRQNLEVLARRIAREGTRWGRTRNLADIPYFAPASSTRLLQAADFVANAVFARYERGYTRDFDQIARRFDRDDDNLHGLVHLSSDRADCFCPACMAWRLRPRPSPSPVEER